MKKKDAGVEEIDQEAPLDSGVENEDDLERSELDNKDENDYKTLYEKEKEKSENYKKSLTQKRQLRKKDDVEDEDVEDEDEDKISKAVQKHIAPLVTAITGNKVDQTLASLVRDPNKQKLVKFYYENRIVRTGTDDNSIRDDLEFALTAVDGIKFRKENGELKRANQNKDTISMSGGGDDKGIVRDKHGFSKAQVEELTKKAQRIGADPQKFIEKTWQNRPKA